MIITFVIFLFFFHTTTIVPDVFASHDDGQPVSETSIDETIQNDMIETKQNDTENLLITFSYHQANIVTIINQLASYKQYNIIFPQGPTALNAIVSFSLKEPVTIDEAWSMLLSILNLAGYVLVSRGNNSYAIMKNNKDIAKEPYQTFIDVDPSVLPDSVETIRYVYYFTNIKFVDKTTEVDFRELFKVMFPADAILAVDGTSNALVIVGKSRDIKGFMDIVQRLDQITFKEEMETIALRYANAATVAQMINEHFIKQDTNRYRLDTKNLPEAAYVNPFTKIIPIPKANSVILLGTRQSIDRIKDFIVTVLDIDLVADNKDVKSVIHIYELQYRDVTSLAEVLKKIVEASRQGGTEQARGKTVQTGVDRTLGEVIIMADRPKQAEESKYYGGNKLVIACSEDDWKQIKSLIEELDTPEDHIFIEILIADLLLGDTRSLSAQFRVPAKFSLPGNMEAQSSQLSTTKPEVPAIIADPSNTAPQTINSDLLRFITPPTTETPGTSLAGFVAQGSTVVSFNDSNGTTWGILNILSQFGHTKTISHPHVTCVNNQRITFSNGQQRLLPDAVAGSVAPVRENKYIDAKLNLEIMPRIVGNFIHTQIKIYIDEFVSDLPNNNTKAIRQVETSAMIPNGGVYVFGGLTRMTNVQSASKVPIFGDLPLFGSLFSRKINSVQQTSLAVFISTTIVQSQFQQEIHEYTADYIELAKKHSQSEGLFAQIKDPVTRWFFKADATNTEKVLDLFIEEHTDPKMADYTESETKNITKIDHKESTSAEKDSGKKGETLQDQTIEDSEEDSEKKHEEEESIKTKESRLRTMLQNEENPFENKKEAI